MKIKGIPRFWQLPFAKRLFVKVWRKKIESLIFGEIHPELSVCPTSWRSCVVDGIVIAPNNIGVAFNHHHLVVLNNEEILNNRFSLAVFKRVYSRWICDDEIVRITGWRSAILQSGTERKRVTFCFWGLG